MNSSSNDRNALATGLAWASRVTTISLEMVVPGMLGVWLDRRLGTYVVFTIAGFAGGLTLAIWHLVKIGNAKNSTGLDEQRDTQDDHGDRR